MGRDAHGTRGMLDVQSAQDAPPIIGFLPLIAYFAVVCGFIALFLVLPRLLARYTHSPTKDMPYECGVDPIGSARQRFSVHFYLVAVLFILFDIEAVFLFPWAVSVQRLGPAGFIEALIFVAVLALGLGYAWRKGVLDWNK
jgi:NADH-quinone oxidoreductase subunit A